MKSRNSGMELSHRVRMLMHGHAIPMPCSINSEKGQIIKEYGGGFPFFPSALLAFSYPLRSLLSALLALPPFLSAFQSRGNIPSFQPLGCFTFYFCTLRLASFLASFIPAALPRFLKTFLATRIIPSLV